MGAIKITSVGKIYPNGTRALGDVNIEINDGEFVVLVGPSGCGKTTLLRMVAGLEDITEGEIFIGEKLVNEVWRAKRSQVSNPSSWAGVAAEDAGRGAEHVDGHDAQIL